MAATAKKTNKEKTSAAGANDPLIQSAVKLIDQAATLLKDGLVIGAGKSAEARHAIKVKASSLVTQASGKLTDAIQQGANDLNKRLKKL